MARDRKRARQRRERAGSDANRHSPVPPESKPVRSEVPGALEHVGSEDEFDAAIVAGAKGVPAEPDAAERAEAEDELASAAAPAAEEPADGSAAPVPAGAAAPAERPAKGGNRVIAFLRASWAELQRVQWPDRRQVVQATAVVLGFVAVAGLYLGLADFVAKEFVEAIL